MAQRVLFFDLLRCVAAFAVVLIHALGPYRHLMGEIPWADWSIAVGLNSLSRWAVPVFIMITGALLLSDRRPFQPYLFVKKRFAKVLLPFLAWSAFYAYLSGWSGSGFESAVASQVMSDFFSYATYYHLGFFYYFLPLYFLIPVYRWLLVEHGRAGLHAFLMIWLLTTSLYMLRIDGPWSNSIWLYSGFLMLGYFLYQERPVSGKGVWVATCLGGGALLGTVVMVISSSMENGEYTVGRWLSYKTINTVLAASMVFVLCQYYAERISSRAMRLVTLISRYSLGIYLLHPLFLWPLYQLEWPLMHPLVGLPIWVTVSGGLALALSWCLSQHRFTAWLVP